MSSLPPDLKDRVLQAALAAPSPTRRASHVQAWLVLPASIIVAASLFFAFDGPEHGRGRPPWFYTASCIGWIAVAALSTWAALARRRSATGPSRALLLGVAAGTPSLLLAMMFALSALDADRTLIHPERLGLKCLGLTLAAAAFPLLALLGVRRGSDPVHPATTGAALGAACGASAGVMVEMWCPVSELRHVALGHVLPIVLLALLGGALGARVLAMRARRRP